MTTTDDQDQWVPLEIGDGEVETFTALRDDVPPWLEATLWAWVFRRFTGQSASTLSEIFRVELARKCERVLRVQIRDAGAWSPEKGYAALRRSFAAAPQIWRLVDFLLAETGRSYATSLQDSLLEAGSAWQVGKRNGKVGLVRRLPEGVKVAAQAAFDKPNAGKRLATAWEDAFGVNPNPSKAYWFAVKAVEDASAPVVIPNDSAPTLGKVISRMEQGGQFNLPHLRQDPRAATHDVLLGMLRMLWVGQHDRHGGLPQSPLPDDVTQPEAEAAVMAAVTLVGWFESGHVQQ
ncbi:hypothetical protein ABGB19_23415 [Mycobacterium sp. B14F4]